VLNPKSSDFEARLKIQIILISVGHIEEHPFILQDNLSNYTILCFVSNQEIKYICENKTFSLYKTGMSKNTQTSAKTTAVQCNSRSCVFIQVTTERPLSKRYRADRDLYAHRQTLWLYPITD